MPDPHEQGDAPGRDPAGTLPAPTRHVSAGGAPDVERQFLALVEQVEDYAIFSIDRGGRPTTWNEGVAHVLGFEEGDFLGHDIAPLIFTPEDYRAGVPQAEFDEAAAAGRASDDRWMRRRDGTRFFAAGATTALRDERGELVGFMKVMRDQTEWMQLQSELQRVVAELAEADRRKSEFLAILAHELRNPLAPLRNAVHVLQRTGLGQPGAEPALAMMNRQILQLGRLIDDLLDVSRITQGKIDLRRETIELASVVAGAVEAARPQCEQRNHNLSVTQSARPVYVDADSARLSQVLTNLLNNACKFTPAGGRIQLFAEREGGEAVIRVKDNGVGLAAEEQQRIFNMFAQVDNTLEKSQGGLGIGLTLAKTLVEMQGGTIAVQSAGPGQGSEFIVRLPAVELVPAPPQPRRDAGSPAVTRRVLIVDDNRDSAQSLAALVQVYGHEVQIAYDGPQAVRAADEYRPDIIVLDIGLPGLSGYDAARQIRQQLREPRPLLVALTGWGQPEDKRRSQEAGFDVHFVKPLDPQQLERVLAEGRPEAGP
jgi:PAS domain S-box-containing protein